MSRKVLLVAFNGEGMCFVHVLLNALDMKAKGFEVKLVIEGAATSQVRELAEEGAPFADLYRQVKEAGLIDCVCKACAKKMGAAEAAEAQGLPLNGEMNGHPSLGRYLEEGFQIITF